MLKNYWLVAIRKLLRHKAHSGINIIGLTIGIASCLIIWLLTRFELSYDNFHPGGDRIYRVVADTREAAKADFKPLGGMIPPLPMALRGELTGCDAVAGFYNIEPTVTIPAAQGTPATPSKKFDRPDQGTPSPIIVAEPQYFKIFTYQWLAGSPDHSLDEPFKVVLTEKQLHRYYGSISPQEALGRPVIYNDSIRTTISGIVKDFEGNTDFAFQDFISISTVPHSGLSNFINLGPEAWGWWDRSPQAFVKLHPGTTRAQVEKQMPAFQKKYFQPASHPENTRLSLQPLHDIHFNEAWTDKYSRRTSLPTLYSLMGVALFILLLAIINFVNLSSAQQLQRTKEIGIRKVLGSRRKDIIYQFLGETLVLTAIAIALSLAITPLALAALHRWLPPGLTINGSGETLLFLLALMIGTTLLAGWLPAKTLSKLLPALSLKGQITKTTRPNRRLKNSLIVFQFTISLVFIIATFIVVRQLHFMLDSDLGFDKDAIFSLHPTGDFGPRDLKTLEQQIRQLPGIARISRDLDAPEAQAHWGTVVNLTGPGDHKAHASLEICEPDYLPLYGLHIIAGRNLYPSDTIREVLINETCARELGFVHPEQALGKLVTTGFGGKGGPIVGIVQDFHSESLHKAIQPFFFSAAEQPVSGLSIKLTPDNRRPEAISATLSRIEQIWHKVLPNEKFAYHFFDEEIAKAYEKEERLAAMLRLAMGIAIAISCMGLLGLVTFAAEQRSKEMSIRKVLGASTRRIFALLTANFLWPVALAIVIATPIAWYAMHVWLQDFVYRVSVPWWIFGIAGVGAIGIALVTVGYQAIRAALMNPADKLRSE
jgi:putative ABC transport system permease protein